MDYIDDHFIDIFFPQKYNGPTLTICVKQYDGTIDNVICPVDSTISDIANLLIYRPAYKKYKKINYRMSFNIGGKMYRGYDNTKINTIPYVVDLTFLVSIHL